jgi:hypothetical protein
LKWSSKPVINEEINKAFSALYDGIIFWGRDKFKWNWKNEQLENVKEEIMSASTSSADLGPVEVGRHLFVLNLHVEMLKIINIVWCRFQDFKFKVIRCFFYCCCWYFQQANQSGDILANHDNGHYSESNIFVVMPLLYI